jgi:uncharacterized protein YPO0396
MITVKQEFVLLKKLKSLSEIEFTGLLQELVEHISKNNWHHIIHNVFYEANDLKMEIGSLEDELDSANDEVTDLKEMIREARSALDKLEIIDDDLQVAVDKIIDILQ